MQHHGWRYNGLPAHHLGAELRPVKAGAAALKGTPNLPLVYSLHRLLG